MNPVLSEAAVVSHGRLFAAQHGVDLWRNNNGAFEDETGRWIRYGLCNDSKALSDKVKSSDYIGIQTIYVGGYRIGIFVAVEFKASDWVFPLPTNVKEYQRCLAQKAFHDIVVAAGGRAGFARNNDELRKILCL